MADLPVQRERNDLLAQVRQRTPARILVAGPALAYRSDMQLSLRADHAAARDAVWDEIELERDLPGLGLFEVATRAAGKQEYLLRPDLGRRLDDAARHLLQQRCPRGIDLQVFVGDGLSAAAVKMQVPALLPLLLEKGRGAGLSVGQPFFVRHCRVGVLNDVGELLDPAVAVLLIGERPGLATAESLSAYMAYRPREGDTDARRNLISNIHNRGVAIEEAANRILALAARMRQLQASGVAVKEALPGQVPEILEREPR
jgi:ethanolamine ammonia-lyase small subunit